MGKKPVKLPKPRTIVEVTVTPFIAIPPLPQTITLLDGKSAAGGSILESVCKQLADVLADMGSQGYDVRSVCSLPIAAQTPHGPGPSFAIYALRAVIETTPNDSVGKGVSE